MPKCWAGIVNNPPETTVGVTREGGHVIDRFNCLLRWLAEAKFAWLSLATNLMAVLFALRTGVTEPQVRITGLVLQLFGIATVAWGISETRALFGQPSVAAKVLAWVKRFPLRRRNVTVSGAAIASSTAFGSASAYATHGAGENPTVESRLDAMEKNIAAIHERITATHTALSKGTQEVKDKLQSEALARSAADKSIAEKLEATSTGGVHISAIGAAWLFVGVLLSTVAPEIAAWRK